MTKKNRTSPPLSAPPPSAIALSRITECRQSGQTWLSLRSLGLSALPAQIGLLTDLTQLDLSDNRLTALPPQLCVLSKLNWLALGQNLLTALPPELWQLTALEYLGLSHNRLISVPTQIGSLSKLKELDLSDNRLSGLPKEMRRLVLDVLRLAGNPGLGIPGEMLGEDQPDELHWRRPRPRGNPNPPDEILAWYFRNRAAAIKRPILEAKVILVGWGGVGKTSLRRRLLNRTFDNYEKTTHKIEIATWPVKVGADEVKLHVWDFGGQEIMHATHQFFLTRRSLYVLVLAGREKVQGDQDAEYWLRLIKSFGDGSPTIVVLNKQCTCPLDLNRRSLQAKYPFIRAFIQTDCEPALRLDELRELILREVDQLPELRTEFDAKWMAIKDGVTDLKLQGRKRMTVAEYLALCRTKREIDEEWQTWLLRFLHTLGVVVCFHEDPRLASVGLLDPQWVVDGIYKVLNEPSLIGGDGRVAHQTIRSLLPRSDYTDDDVQILLGLMEKFQLCFWLEESRTEFVVPELMTKQEPDWSATFSDTERALHFELKYEFLPEGLLPRFIVATHHLSRKGERWRSGVILHNKLGNAALIRGDAAGSPPLVRIVVNGPVPTRRELLGVIRHEFDKINHTITGLEVQERVPVPGYDVEPPVYDHLVRAEAAGKKTWAIFPPGGGVGMVEIPFTQLLDGIDPKPKRQARAKRLASGVVFEGDYIEGDKHVTEKKYEVGGSVQKGGIVGDHNEQTITNSFNHCADPTAAERELTNLKQLLAELLPKLPEDKKAEAEVHAEKIEEAATSKDPKSRTWYNISTKGLLEAAQWAKDFSANIGGTLLNLGKAVWPDFQLPNVP